MALKIDLKLFSTYFFSFFEFFLKTFNITKYKLIILITKTISDDCTALHSGNFKSKRLSVQSYKFPTFQNLL